MAAHREIEECGGLVSPAWLSAHISDVKVLDASWYLPVMEKDAEADWQSSRIRGAMFFDIDKIAMDEAETGLPHMLPTPEHFAKCIGELGISNSDIVVVYDRWEALTSATRAWWTFVAFGHSHVVVLDGGYNAFERDYKHLIDTNPPEAAEAVEYAVPTAVASACCSKQLLLERASPLQIVDARASPRFLGADPEPRPGLRRGHVPAAINVPFRTVSKDGVLLGKDALREMLEAAGIDLTDSGAPIVAYCGSGITACVVAFAVWHVAQVHATVYDGSFAEWGKPELGLPLVLETPEGATP